MINEVAPCILDKILFGNSSALNGADLYLELCFEDTNALNTRSFIGKLGFDLLSVKGAPPLLPGFLGISVRTVNER